MSTETTKPVRCMFVCHGNICRSPMAEGIFRKMATDAGLNFVAESSGVTAEHEGESADPRAVEKMHKEGIDISNHIARKIEASDFSKYDYILAMDQSNYTRLLEMQRAERASGNIQLFLREYGSTGTTSVPDPYWGSSRGFDTVFDLLTEATATFISTIKSTAASSSDI